MSHFPFRQIFILAGGILLSYLAVRYALPLAMPFLLGGLVALAAEPVVRLFNKRLKLPRGSAAAVGVSATLILVSCVVVLLSSAAVRQVGRLGAALPELTQTAVAGLEALEGYLHTLARQTPEAIRSTVDSGVTQLFHSGNTLVGQLTGQLPAMLRGLLSLVSGSALSIGTGILAAFMVSARLPRLRRWLEGSALGVYTRQFAPSIRRLKAALGGYLKAQLMLCGLSFLIVTGGLLLLRVSHAPAWGLLIALVDAIPILGTGTVLLPWSLILLTQGQFFRAAGLLATYAAAFLTRTVLEPRLVGRQLGLDPLVALVCLYVGFQLWGIGGLLLGHILEVAHHDYLSVHIAKKRQGIPKSDL